MPGYTYGPDAPSQFGVAQYGMQPGMQPGMHLGIHSGIHPGMYPGMYPGIHPGIHPGLQPGMQPGIHPGMHPGIPAGKSNVPGFSKMQQDLQQDLQRMKNMSAHGIDRPFPQLAPKKIANQAQTPQGYPLPMSGPMVSGLVV